MFKIKKLNCNKFTVAILSSFLALSANAEGLDTTSPPVAQIGQLPAPTNVIDNAKNAFDVAMQRKSGLNAKMIEELRKNFEDKQRATSGVGYEDFTPQSRTVPISLGVSSQKEVVRLAKGYATSISVVDSTGKPWNVVNVTLGNQNAFKYDRLDGEDGNLFSLTAQDNYARSNIIFTLKEGPKSIKVPVVLDLISGQKMVDDKLVLRIQSIGPNGSIEETKLSQGVDSKYISWLDGVLPSNIKKLRSDDKFLKAWKDTDGSIVVITKYLIYSPLSTVMLSSSDGEATLYKLSSKSSILRAMDPISKEEKTIKITGF